MAEPEIVVEHREHLWYLLAEAAQVEHLIMCQYLYASFSLKAGPQDGLTAEQAAAVLLQTLNRFFTHTDETDEQLQTLVSAAFGLMRGVLRPLGRTLPRLPAGPDHPGRTAGPTFEMYYQFGNFVPWREPAWALLSERAAMLETRSAEASALPGALAAVNDAAAAAAGIAAQLLAHVPEQLRHVRATRSP